MKPFLDDMLLHASSNPSFLNHTQRTELEQLASSADKAYEMFFSDAKKYLETTVFNNKNFDVAYDNDVSNTIKRYLKDGEKFKFKDFSNLDEYMTFVGQQKTKLGVAAVTIQNIAQILKHLAYKPLINNYVKKTKGAKEKQLSMGGEGGKTYGISDMGSESQVTRRNEIESEALRMVEPLFNCVRQLYEKFADRIKTKTDKNKPGFYELDESVARDLNKLKKELHKYFIAKYVSGVQDKVEGEYPEQNVTDAEFARVANTTERNLVKVQILNDDKFDEFLAKQHLQDPDMYQYLLDVTGVLYYIGLIKPLLGDREAIINMRKKFIELVPQSFKQRINEDNLKNLTFLAKLLPKITYDTNLEELAREGFVPLMNKLASSNEFPTSYLEAKKTASGKSIRTGTKPDAISTFLAPIFDILGSKETIMHLASTMGSEEFSEMLQRADCEEIFKHFGVSVDEEEV